MYVDEIGFVRKPRQWGEVFAGTIGVSFILYVLGRIFGTVSPVTGIAALVSMASITWGIVEYASSHKVDTWRHRKYIDIYVILAGCLLVIPGILTYYYFKARETSYLRKHKLDAMMSNLNDKD